MTTYGLFQPSKLLAAMIGVSLLLHVLLYLVLSGIDLRLAAPGRRADTVELLLADDLPPALPDPAADPSQPREVVLIPESHASAAPDRADYLAEFNSRAADLVPGGEAGAQPAARRESEAPMVAIEREQLDGAATVAVEPSVILPPTPRPAPAEPVPTPPGSEISPQGDVPTADLAEPRDRATTEPSETPPADPGQTDVRDWISEQRTASLLGQGDRGFDFNQLEGGDVQTNVDIVGGYRLNTYEWNFVPWIRRFANDLQRAWIPPYAYRLGVIHGQTEVRVVVERDGTPSRMDVLSKEGHKSLHTASLAALQACAPYLPLPPDFPKDQLVIVFTLIYPDWQRR
ncbi:MAG: energy transducer TonB [Candidatus Krumholzibacteriia bacterium]